MSADGGKIGGTTNIAQIDTTGASSGSYTVRGHVSDGPKIGRSGDCTAAYIVMAYQPPTIACSANPSSLRSGDSASITAQGMSPQGRPLTYSYTASAGTVSGTSSSATLSTAGVSPNVINVTCNVMDDKGQSASATTLVTIVTPPQPQVIATQNLCNVNFARDKKRPTRVDNEAKACLDDIALTLQRSTDAKIALIGHSIDDQPDAAMQRAIHTRDYLVTDKGIDASRILIYVGPSNSKAVDTILIPSGAALNKDGLTER